MSYEQSDKWELICDVCLVVFRCHIYTPMTERTHAQRCHGWYVTLSMDRCGHCSDKIIDRNEHATKTD